MVEVKWSESPNIVTIHYDAQQPKTHYLDELVNEHRSRFRANAPVPTTLPLRGGEGGRERRRSESKHNRERADADQGRFPAATTASGWQAVAC